MQDQALVQYDNGNEVIEKLILHGDLNGLNPMEKIQYYKMYCERIGLDPATQPFKILRFQGKEILYCDRSGAQQLNKLHNVSHKITNRETIVDCYVVTACAYLPDGRQTESIGAVSLMYPDEMWSKQHRKYVPHPKAGQAFQREDLCNALMKAETKAKRRSTLDLLGLGILDETETESIPNAQPVSPQQIEQEASRNDYIRTIQELLESSVFSEEEIAQGKQYLRNGKDLKKFAERLKYIVQERTRPTSGPADESKTHGEQTKAPTPPQSWVPPDSNALEALQKEIDRLKGLRPFAATAENSAQYADGQAYHKAMAQVREYKDQARDLSNKIVQEIESFLPAEDTEEYQEALSSFREAFRDNEPKTIAHYFHMISFLVAD